MDEQHSTDNRLDAGFLEDSERVNTSWNNLLPEILENIFSFLQPPLNPNELARQRLVCRKWCDVVDDLFLFKLIVNDKNSDITQLGHVRANSMIISSLSNTDLDLEASFLRDPGILSSLNVWGCITPKNFQLLLSNAINLSRLSLNSLALRAIDLMEPATPLNLQEMECWRSLQSLELAEPAYTNLLQFLITRMPELNTFKLILTSENSDWELSRETKYWIAWRALRSFLEGSSCPKLTNLCLRWSHFLQQREQLVTPTEPFKGSHQLETLQLHVQRSFIPLWIPIIKAQGSLRNLRIRLIKYVGDNFPPEQLCLFNTLERMLVSNQSSLSVVDLQGFHLDSELNAGVIFGEMRNLKQLVLHIDCDSAVNSVSSLASLPESLELLNLHGINCNRAEDLILMVDRLEKIKYVELVKVAVEGIRGSIPSQVVDGFTTKAEIRLLKISPVFLSEAECEVENGVKYHMTPNGKKIRIIGNTEININF